MDPYEENRLLFMDFYQDFEREQERTVSLVRKGIRPLRKAFSDPLSSCATLLFSRHKDGTSLSFSQSTVLKRQASRKDKRPRWGKREALL